MINGILLFEQGGVQQIGELTTLDNIIKTIKLILPDLEKQQRKILFDSLSTEEMAAVIKEREAALAEESKVKTKRLDK
jgi:hypothetical protein